MHRAVEALMGNTRGKGLSLARRLYRSRVFGLLLGLMCVSVAMHALDPPLWVWGLMLFNGLVWPHLAFLWARSSSVPFRAEHRNLLIDAFMGGFWVAAMQFNPLPSATTISMMAMNNVAIGGRAVFAGGHGGAVARYGRRAGGVCAGVHPANNAAAAVRLFAVAVAVSAGAGLDLLSPGLDPRSAQARAIGVESHR